MNTIGLILWIAVFIAIIYLLSKNKFKNFNKLKKVYETFENKRDENDIKRLERLKIKEAIITKKTNIAKMKSSSKTNPLTAGPNKKRMEELFGGK